MLTINQQQALSELHDVIDQLESLSYQAREAVKSFPQLQERADAYGVFNFGFSNNRYDTSLATIIEEIEENA